MKTIFFIINSLKGKGGCERVACNLANIFTEKCENIIYILNRDTEQEQVTYNLNSKVQVLSLTGNLLDFYRKIQKNIDNINPDCIVIYNMGRLSLLSAFLRKNNSKIISFEHVSYSSRPFWVRVLSKFVFFRFDKFVTLTIRDLEFYDKKKCVVIPNISPFPISLKQYDINSRKIIAIGRLNYQKNFQALLLAWQKIQHKLEPEWYLEIYGTGEDELELKNNIQKNGFQNVFLKGNENNMQKVYEEASFLVMSSRFEGLPMVLIEALSFGLPLISFDCPFGPREVIINDKNGILVENQNIDLLAESILKLSSSLEERVQYSDNSKKLAKNFSSETILKLWKQILN